MSKSNNPSMNWKYTIPFCLLLALASATPGHGQTTLSGDYVVDGDLAIGTTTNKSSVVVNGETGSTAAPSLAVFGDGLVFFGYSADSPETLIPDIYGQPRMYWDPLTGTFRAGKTNNSMNVGENSAAFGDSNAVGAGSFAASGGVALGLNSFAANGGVAEAENGFAVAGQAIWSMSFALGGMACNSMAVALPGGNAVGQNSLAMGGDANGNHSVALNGNATGSYSFAAAQGIADGDGSVAFGGYAAFSASVAFGGNANAYGSVAFLGAGALGDRSFAYGGGSVSLSYGSFVVGQCNVQDYNQNFSQWQNEDELFVIGNGTGKHTDPPEVQHRNALVVYKSGDVKIPKRQGDILMGEFGNPE